ncbi:MAG TPA: hypothetical protein VKR81_05495 [Candidatus Binatia bacterium]|nr:hypothetical protein [Candidatus Binatia bacterium]
MALRLGPLKLPWLVEKSHENDPYWDLFINRPPADLANTAIEMIRKAAEGNVFPTKAELHTPDITSSHVKGMAEYFGAERVGIVRLNAEDNGDGEFYPFAVVCAVHADYDPRTSLGIGGQVPVQNGLFITFILSAWIRELGFRATAKQKTNVEKLAAKAGLGTLNSDGRLITPQFGAKVYVAEAIFTDLPLAADG